VLSVFQQGHTYANTAKTYLVNINAVNQWIARYKKDGIIV
jgi:transposase